MHAVMVKMYKERRYTNIKSCYGYNYPIIPTTSRANKMLRSAHPAGISVSHITSK